MSAESTGLSARIRYARVAFRHWRWQRPFWAGLLTLLAGVPIAYFPYANLTLGQLTVRMATTAGSGSLIIGVLLSVLGLTMWFQSAVRVFAGVATILLALVSLVVSNFGGFLVGFLLALLGGSLSIAWAPGSPDAAPAGGLPAEAGQEFDPAAQPGAAGVPGRPADPYAQPADPYAQPAPVHAGARTDEETNEENGRHRAE